jgi:hypothetical protein
MVSENTPVKWWGWVLISAILFATIGVLLYYVILLKDPVRGLPPEIVLGAALVIGVIALIIALTFMTVIFKSLNLTNSENSLGLPEGSIRAVIALSLILIFMISSVFLYYQVENGGRYTSEGVTQAQIDNMSPDGIVSIDRVGTYHNESIFTVTRLVENQTSEDIAKQIITTVSTLVVAIAGFYFGTKAVGAVKAAPEVSSPVIRRIETTELKQGEEKKEFKIFGKNFELAKEVKLVRDSGPIECTDIKSNATEITCSLKINDDAQPGKYTVHVKNSDGGEDRLEDAFEVKPK